MLNILFPAFVLSLLTTSVIISRLFSKATCLGSPPSNRTGYFGKCCHRALAVLQIAPLLISVSYAHSWYLTDCCTGDEAYGDCHPVPCDSITEQTDGLHWRDVVFTRGTLRVSQDQYCHVCVQRWDDGT
jgi:hypothetical protein